MLGGHSGKERERTAMMEIKESYSKNKHHANEGLVSPNKTF
jgi:hypothetical protein